MTLRTLRDDLHAHAAAVAAPAFGTADAPDVRSWLAARAKEYAAHHLMWLLAHADDGVIWGRLAPDGPLVTSHEAARGHDEALAVCPPLRAVTLQQARLFGDGGELLLWRGGDGRFQARLLHDVDGDGPYTWNEGFDEPQLLWGTPGRGQPLAHGFHLWRHGAEGLRHALPLGPDYFSDDEAPGPPRLRVRHYLPAGGFARVVASRLVTFSPGRGRSDR